MPQTVPPTGPSLDVAAGSQGLQEARHWVVDTMHAWGRPELAETTELGVGELMTNAVLHAEPPIEVRVRGTRVHPRVEVHDGSVEPPLMPAPIDVEVDPLDLDEDALLVTFGRGLEIVARSADAWGADIETAGKVVWFTPAAEVRDVGVPGAVTGAQSAASSAPPAGSRACHLLGVPWDHLRDFQRHYQELRREVRLLALSHASDYPLAGTLADLFDSLQRELHSGLGVDPRQLQAGATGATDTTHPGGTVDLVLHLSPESARTMGRFVELLDFADEFCRQERLLSLERSAEQRAFQTWFFSEVAQQQGGRAAQPWAGPTTGYDFRAQA